MKKYIYILIVILLTALMSTINFNVAHAETLTDNINEQLLNLDISKLEDFYNSIIDNSAENINVSNKLLSILKGEYNTDYSSIYNILFTNILIQIKYYTPIILSIIAIAIFCTIINNVKGNTLSQSTSLITNLVCSLSIILILYKEIYSMYTNTKIIIENIAKLNEIMSPIIITLMVATGSNVSASVYSPQTLLLSGIITNIFLKVILPLVITMTIISISGELSGTTKLNSFIDFISSLIKWIIGISFTIFAIFITTQGLTSATFDSASIKATKYAISNSIPIVGGFLKDGFDIMLAGSVLIKNALGIIALITMATLIFSPVIKMIVFSLLLKIATAIIELFSRQPLANHLKNTAKCISYFNVSTLICGFMFFLTILLSIISANAFL